jgi:hypothetical protein
MSERSPLAASSWVSPFTGGNAIIRRSVAALVPFAFETKKRSLDCSCSRTPPSYQHQPDRVPWWFRWIAHQLPSYIQRRGRKKKQSSGCPPPTRLHGTTTQAGLSCVARAGEVWRLRARRSGPVGWCKAQLPPASCRSFADGGRRGLCSAQLLLIQLRCSDRTPLSICIVHVLDLFSELANKWGIPRLLCAYSIMISTSANAFRY